MLRNEKVLVAGGKNGSVILNTAVVYDPVTSTFSGAGGTMNVERYRQTATLLTNGQVLVAGGGFGLLAIQPAADAQVKRLAARRKLARAA